MKSSFTTSDITRGLEIPKERFREWVIRDYIKPSVPSPGQGQAAWFTIDEVYRVQLFRTMIEGGYSREAAAGFLSCTRERKDPWLHHCQFIFYRRTKEQVITMVSIHDDEAVMSKDEKNQLVLDLTSGFPGQPLGETVDVWSPEDWSDIYIVNVRAIRDFVDLRMRGE
jgi:hypothetical protein